MTILQRTRPPTAASSDPAAIAAAAFARLYGDYFDPIYWYCRSRLDDATAAEDAAATVFTHALAAGPRYADPALRSWLFGIAHNVLANRFRAARPVAALDAVLSRPDPGPLPSDVVVAQEERERLLGALQRLPSDQRRVVELRLAGLTGAEIAETLARSRGAVKMLQLRAFACLRDLLGDAAGHEGTDRHG